MRGTIIFYMQEIKEYTPSRIFQDGRIRQGRFLCDNYRIIY